MDTVSIVAHVTCVWLVRIQLWVPFYFILTENKGMGSGHFYKKRTDFAWVDRQPAFITGGAPGLHMYSIYSTSFSQDGFLASVVTIFIYSTVCIQCIYCIYTVRLRAR